MAPNAGKRDKKGKKKAKLGPVRPIKEAKWDDEARREFLTGFSKRKQARKVASRQKAEARDKEELRRMRNEMRQKQKEQAAENVRAAQAAFDEEPEESGDADEASEQQPEVLETEEYRTVVTVEEFDPTEAPEPLPRPSKRIVLPEASGKRANMKRLKQEQGIGQAKKQRRRA